MSTITKDTIDAVIFDLDGTLIDTEKIYRKIWPEAMASLGYVYTDKQYLSMRSLGRPYSPAKFKSWYGDDFDYNLARRTRKKLFDEYISKNGIQRKPGAIKLLDFLRKNGITTAIATATDLDRATEYLKMTGLFDYFDKIISATMVDEGKPSPKVYEYACSQLGYTSDRCIAVEDAPNGITSAYRAGCKVIMVPDQTPCTEDLEPMLFACVDSLDKICEIITK